MFNQEIITVLTVARQQQKWAPIKYLKKYGLYHQNIPYLEDKGLITVKESNEHGIAIRLTAEGYYQALTILKNRNRYHA